jgi:predicted phosphoribosyltransferase
VFENRRDAGRQLGEALQSHPGLDEAIVLAIPRGGVEIGYEVARAIGADLSLLVARKLPFLSNPEAGFGAVAEDGSVRMGVSTSTAGRPNTFPPRWWRL